MGALRRSAFWPQVLAIASIGLSAAGCSSDSGRFNEGFNFSSDPQPAPRSDVTGSIPQQRPPASHVVESRPLPRVADNGGDGVSGGGRGMGSFQPAGGEITGSLPPAAPPPPPPPSWTWEGGTPVTVKLGESLETLSRHYGVPVDAIMHANNITSAAMVHPGEHLVIPRLRGPSPALAAPQTRLASSAPAPAVPSTAPVGPPRAALAPGTEVHVVSAGETLHSIARLYGKPVLMLAKANNIPPDARVRIGDRIVVPDARASLQPAPIKQHAEVPAPAAGPTLATADSPHSARLAAATEPAGENGTTKTAETTGALPSFRWPARGRVIAGFGPKPNGLQNDGINLAVPEGTPVKAAEDGVVAYAGNELKGYGNLVLIRHSNGFVTAYAHASEILVKRGDQVKRGQMIAKSGQTGSVTAPQLHFEIRKGATPVDPSQYLSGA
jgi:murein DD-endopeptidase MepM/ murein hydrolase activator NlpD